MRKRFAATYVGVGSAVLAYVTRHIGVPIDLVVILAAVTWAVVAHERKLRRLAVSRADEQQHRADILVGPRVAPTLTEMLRARPLDELVGHDDRALVLDRLGDRYADGYLTASEHEARTAEAVQARTRGQLTHVLRDLP